MAVLKPFKGIRPNPKLADKVASPPYDVLNSDEAREMAKDNPYSFLHINKPEIDLPADINLYDEKVYQKGAENLNRFRKEEIFIQDKKACFYIYRQIMGTHSQVGLVAGASVDEYQNDLIKKHELTRAVKEEDRINHVRHLNAQTGPVFLTYKARPEIDNLVEKITMADPVYDFKSDDNIKHTVWVVDDDKDIDLIRTYFSKIDYLYVADGHHRSAAASRVAELRKNSNPKHTGDEEYNYFLSVIFPDNQMYIMDYNRVVTDLNNLSKDEFLARIREKFDIKKLGKDGFKPMEKHAFVMYLEESWYLLHAHEDSFNEQDPVARLDVSVLQTNLLSPILGIGDPRKDDRIDFVGGIRGLKELKKRVDSGEMKVAFALFPTSIEDLMSIADAGKTMPPKSTWFEPKLRSGLLIHELD